MKKVLILNGQYLPGYKGGGPIQSCASMVENLKDDFEFYILTGDRDLNEIDVYPNIESNAWNDVGNAKVYYMSKDKENIQGFQEFFTKYSFDIIYMNGFFSPLYTIKPLILRWQKKIKLENIILTPRGDFTGGCENKKLKKYTYIYLVKLLGLYKNITWHATSEIEAKDIKKKFSKARIVTAQNFPSVINVENEELYKEKGKLKLIFVSRVFPKKNLKFALEALKNVDAGEIIYDIYGPMEDKAYWDECVSVIKELPANIKVEYKGEISHDEILKTYPKYHGFLFPTLGENYGHVIVEAMMNECPCIMPIGVTPWDKYLQGYNIGGSLDNKKSFEDIISNLVNMENDDMQVLRKGTKNFIINKLEIEKTRELYKKILKDQ